MTCKRGHLSHGLSFFAVFVAVFTFVVGLGAPDAIASTPLFLPVVTYDPAGQSLSVAVADVNGDGKPDLLVANACIAAPGSNHNSDCSEGSISVLLGKGDGTFQSAVSYKSGGKPCLFGGSRRCEWGR